MEESNPNIFPDESNQDSLDIEIEFNSLGNLEQNENITNISEYAVLYKANSLQNTQENRRKTLLNIQKMKRNTLYDLNRGISESTDSDDDTGKSKQHGESYSKPMSKYERIRNKYRNTTMFSEWLTEVPDDLETEWYVKLCPIGVRNLIIADKFKTKAFKNGKSIRQFQSHLPAGRSQGHEKDSLTVLDCIFNRNLHTIFVLDVIVWKGYHLHNAPASMRFFWLNSRLDEIINIKEISYSNQFRIVEVPKYPAERNIIEELLAQPYRYRDEIVPLDGVLLYHKEAWYKNGYTPLVGWLKPYMIPEKLHIPVCEYFMQQKPDNYVSLEDYLSKCSKLKGDVVMKDDSENLPDTVE